MGVAEEENIRFGRPGLGDGGVIAGFNAPQVSVGQEDTAPLKSDLLDGGDGGPAVAVARDHADGKLRVEIGHLLCIGDQVSQVDDLVGLLLVDGLDHAGPGTVGVGKYKDLQICHLTCCAAYTKTETGLGVSKDAAQES